MQTVPVLEHQSGRLVAEVPLLGNHFAKTANYNLTEADSGKTFSNTGAGATVTFKMPVPKVGKHFRFVKVASQTIVLNPNGSEKIDAGATALTSETAGTSANLANVTIACLDGVNWHVLGLRGVWTAS